MRRSSRPALLALALALGLLAAGPLAAAVEPEAEADAGQPSERWLVGLREGAEVAGPTFGGARVLDHDEASGTLVLAEEPALDEEALDAVRFVEPELRYQAFRAPNDPLLSQQHALRRAKLLDAWEWTRGSTSVKVCIVDTGLARTHEDIGRYVDGWDFVEGDDDPQDENRHGTHVASIAAAVSDNGKGIAGAAQVSLLVARVLDGDAVGPTSAIAAGIRWCADRGAAIISISLGGPTGSSVVLDAVRYAAGKGALLVAAAGNSGCSPCVAYPAAYSEVMAVGCVDARGDVCAFSSRGPQLELVAAGSGILGADAFDDRGYVLASGTSMSAPLVAGAAALVKSAEPGLSARALRERLAATAAPARGAASAYGHGELDALAAVAPPGVLSFSLRNRATEVPAYEVSFWRGDALAGACEVDVVLRAMDCGELESPAFGRVELPAGAYEVVFAAEDMQEQTKRVTVKAAKTTSVRVSLKSPYATLALVLPADAPPRFTLQLTARGAAAACDVDVAAEEILCEGDAVPRAWPTLRLPPGTYRVQAESEDEHRKDLTKNALRLSAGKRTTFAAAFGYEVAAVRPQLRDAQVTAYTMTVLQGATTLARCEADLADWAASACDATGFSPSPTPGIFYLPKSGAAKWTLVFEPAGEHEGAAQPVSTRAQKYTARLVEPTIRFRWTG